MTEQPDFNGTPEKLQSLKLNAVESQCHKYLCNICLQIRECEIGWCEIAPHIALHQFLIERALCVCVCVCVCVWGYFGSSASDVNKNRMSRLLFRRMPDFGI